MEEQSVRVCLRIRPLNNVDLAAAATTATTTTDPHAGSAPPRIPWEYSKTQIRMLASEGPTSRTSSFDSVLGPDTNQEETFSRVATKLVSKAMEGFNGTIFAYGQTGSGKTWSMSGVQEFDHEHAGIAPRALQQVFDHIAAHPSREFLLRMAFMEFYNEEINDLLGAVNSSSESDWRDLRILREDPTKGCIVENLTEVVVDSPERALEVMIQGEASRHVGTTSMNARSSRSHLVMRLVIESSMPEDPSSHVQDGDDSDSDSDDDLFRNLSAPRTNRKGNIHKSAAATKKSKSDATLSFLNLVDLAGSERQRNTKALGIRLKEGASINQSLLNLGKVISKLSEQSAGGDDSAAGASSPKNLRRTASSRDAAKELLRRKKSSRRNNTHIPFRNSKLTRILKSSLGGNASTAVLLTMTGAPAFAEESMSTIKFGELCKKIKNRVRKNDVGDKTKTMLRQYRQEIESLRKELDGVKMTIPSSVQERSPGSDSKEKLRSTQGELEKARQENDEANKKVAEMQQRLTSMKMALFNSNSAQPRGKRSARGRSATVVVPGTSQRPGMGSEANAGSGGGDGEDDYGGGGGGGGSEVKDDMAPMTPQSNTGHGSRRKHRKHRKSMFITNATMASLRFSEDPGLSSQSVGNKKTHTRPNSEPTSPFPPITANGVSLDAIARAQATKRANDLSLSLEQAQEETESLKKECEELRAACAAANENAARLSSAVHSHADIETKADGYLDFSETNPFGEVT